MERLNVLIADDSRMNRELLSSMLEDQYDITQAEDGEQAVELLRGDASRFSALLLDIQMPGMDGFDVLACMNKHRWIEELPVIIISAENSPAYIERAYALGATDYVPRPFDETVVKHRIYNTILLTSKQRRLTGIVTEQLREKRRSDQLMISILAHIVEFRNGESGLHVMHIHVITQMLLKRLIQKTGRYALGWEEIEMISLASALHDIGKLSIPDAILNKPGRFTPEEFEIMKGHAAAGAGMLRDLPFEGEPLIKTAHEICRWHHERYDGRGYPDGLTGDEIPISAQVVSLADVYDALTSERCYKKAYSHRQALDMILGGQCGAFNPLLLTCLEEIGDELVQRLKLKSPSMMDAEETDGEHIAEQLHRLRAASAGAGVYPPAAALLKLNECGAKRLDLDALIERPLENGTIRERMPADTLRRFREKLREAAPGQPDFQLEVEYRNALESHAYHCAVHTIWQGGAGACTALVAKLTDDGQACAAEAREEISGLPEKISIRSMNAGDARALLSCLRDCFDTVRLVDPRTNTQIAFDEAGICREMPYVCYQIWNRTERCENCISEKCVTSRDSLTKFEIVGQDIYHMRASYVEIDGYPYALEMMDRITEKTLLQGLGKDHLIRSIADYHREIYTDPVTGINNRRFYEEQLCALKGVQAVVMIDVDAFKKINDTYGHRVGDLTLAEIAGVLVGSVRKTDAVARYGGDEFVVVFPEIPAEKFAEKLREMSDRAKAAVLPGYGQIRLSISVGGVYGPGRVSELTAMADNLMYQAKREGCGVKVRLPGGVITCDGTERML
jgi:diguanylate cyclase (GGDEF)-like protein